MPNGFDFDFKDAYGHEFDEMNRKEKDMAIMSQLYYLRREVGVINGKTRPVPRLEKLTWAGAAIIPALIAWLAWLTKSWFGR